MCPISKFWPYVICVDCAFISKWVVPALHTCIGVIMLLVVHDAYNEGIVMSDGQLTRRNIICCFKKKNCSSFTICYIEGKCFGKYMYQVYAKWTCTCGFVYMFNCCNIHTGRCLLRPALLTLNWYSLNYLFSIMFPKLYILWFNAWIDVK